MYLGGFITEDERSEKNIETRTMIARTTFANTITLLSCRGINLNTRFTALNVIYDTILRSRDVDNYKMPVVQTQYL